MYLGINVSDVWKDFFVYIIEDIFRHNEDKYRLDMKQKLPQSYMSKSNIILEYGQQNMSTCMIPAGRCMQAQVKVQVSAELGERMLLRDYWNLGVCMTRWI